MEKLDDRSGNDGDERVRDVEDAPSSRSVKAYEEEEEASDSDSDSDGEESDGSQEEEGDDDSAVLVSTDTDGSGSESAADFDGASTTHAAVQERPGTMPAGVVGANRNSTHVSSNYNKVTSDEDDVEDPLVQYTVQTMRSDERAMCARWMALLRRRPSGSNEAELRAWMDEVMQVSDVPRIRTALHASTNGRSIIAAAKAHESRRNRKSGNNNRTNSFIS